jgi:hypothetical protein
MKFSLTRITRAFLLLMMVLLPLQAAWAGSDVDCQSSLLVPCSHDTVAVASDIPANSSSGAHLDDFCACHLGHADVVVAGFDIIAAKADCPTQAKAPVPMASHLAPPPERPQWA